jgi:hypothetical protein
MKPQIEQLKTEVARVTTVNASAVTLINGISARIQKAVDEALANGATAEELAPLTDLNTALSTASTELSAAVVANTPAA